MALTLDPGSVVNAASGLLLLLLGAAIALLGPRRRDDALLALFAGALGWRFFLGNLLSDDDPLRLLHLPTSAIATFVAAVALVGVALAFPRRLRPAERGLLRVPALLAGATLLALVPAMAEALAAPPTGAAAAFPALAGWNFLEDEPGLVAVFVASVFMLALLAERWRAAPGPAEERYRRQVVLMAAALVLYPAVLAGADLSGAFGPSRRTTALYGVVEAASLAGVAALWLRNCALAAPPGSRPARDLALLTLGVPLASLVLSRLLPPDHDVHFGLSRVLAVGLLAYAILRHQLLGLDVRVKWTVRQGTVAAAFIGLFFVVSESASQFFASDANLGPYAGIAAAGLLVFALAPLQRAAERVADAAMPGVEAPGQLAPDERRRLYLEQARAAWADGAISRDERRLLDGLREGLGLTRDQASRLESEAAGAGPGRRGRRGPPARDQPGRRPAGAKV